MSATDTHAVPIVVNMPTIYDYDARRTGLAWSITLYFLLIVRRTKSLAFRSFWCHEKIVTVSLELELALAYNVSVHRIKRIT
jgi:hypothetical protein